MEFELPDEQRIVANVHRGRQEPVEQRLNRAASRKQIPISISNVYGQVDGRKNTTPEDRWYVSANEVNADGSLSEKRVPDTFIWDIVRDASGSPILVGTKTSGYWPQKDAGVFVTRLGSCSGDGTITWKLSKPGLPLLAPAFREKDISSSSGHLMSVLVTENGVATQ